MARMIYMENNKYYYEEKGKEREEITIKEYCEIASEIMNKKGEEVNKRLRKTV